MPPNGTQAQFARALLDRAAPPSALRFADRGEALDRRFGVYRNNVFASLTSVLRTRFPAVEALVGTEFFSGMAAGFVAAHPPSTPVLLEYGGAFPAFVENFGPAQTWPYMAGVAALEWALHEASHAADADPIAIDALAAIDPSQIGGAHLVLHPSVRLIASDYPIVSIWRINVETAPLPEELSGAEHALIVRPDVTVSIHELSVGAHAFLSATANAASLGQALAAAQAAQPDFKLAATLALVFSAGAVAGVAHP